MRNLEIALHNLRISQSKLVYTVETGSFSLKVMVLASSPRPALTVRHLVFSHLTQVFG